MKLGELLVKNGLITEELLELALKEQKRTGEMLGEVLLRLGFVSEEEILKLLSKQHGEEDQLDRIIFDEELIHKIPKEVALRYHIIPISLNEGVLYVATTAKLGIDARTVVKKYINFKDLKEKVISQVEFDRYFKIYYGEKFNIDVLVDELLKRIDRNINIGEDRSIIILVDHIIRKGVEDGATDIHIEPGETVTRIRYRVDGVLKIGLVLPKKLHNSIIVRIKVVAGLDISETRLPQDGHFSFTYVKKEIDIRLSTLPSTFGEVAVLRLLNISGELPELSKLGFSKEEFNLLKTVAKQPYGIILTSGPTGSGKTTTLYAMLNEVFTLKKAIITVEDPPEIKWDLIRQVGINEKVGLTFSRALRSILRQDPDTILVGEIRDEDTAQISVKAAMTGHLVLSTIHTNTSTEIPLRIVNMGVDAFSFAPVFLAGIGQRLVRKICPYCKEEYTASDKEKEILKFDSAKEVKLYKGKKCEKCNFTGYLGRVVISELFVPDTELQNDIIHNISAIELRQKALEKGMKSMYQDAVIKVLSGITTVEELERVLKTTERE